MKDIKHIRWGFSFGRLGHASGLGLGGTVGGCGCQFFLQKFNQIWYMSYLNEWHMQRHHFLGSHPLGPLGGAKWSNINQSELQRQNSKIFRPNFVYHLINERYIIYQPGFLFGRLGHAQGLDFGVLWGVGGQFFSEIQTDLVCELLTLHMYRHNFWGPQPLGPWGGVKI